MNQRKVHQVLGLIMLLPLLAWAATGVIFLTKPGYESAYERLSIKTYDIGTSLNIPLNQNWEEIRVIRSVLGLHVLAKEKGTVEHYDFETLLPSELPDETEIVKLVSDAISANPERYGVVERVEGLTAHTSTGVEISLNWHEMTLSQHGKDRKVIETLYKIHYLQWTKWEGLNKVLGVVGLFCLAVLTIVGFSAYFSRAKRKV